MHPYSQIRPLIRPLTGAGVGAWQEAMEATEATKEGGEGKARRGSPHAPLLTLPGGDAWRACWCRVNLSTVSHSRML
jgi:hypothetical protein